ncbi:MAG TPA: hypothetical protein VHE80_04095, partial [Acidimicrobiales bacterium]|nr:hypothetical protein [Acidimicrobiales bacterium]
TAFQPGRRRLLHAGLVAALGGLLAGFWALPLVVRLPYSNDMGWEKLVEYGRLLFPAELRWVMGLAVAGVVVSALRGCRTGAALAALALITGLAFRFAPETRLWNGRLLPFWFLSIYLLAGVAVASLPRAVAWLLGAERGRGERVGVMAMPMLALVAAFTFLDGTLDVRWWPSPLHPEQRPFLPDWVKWNYAGYEDEGKPRREEYFQLVRTMEDLGRTHGCGRAMWEYEFELNDMGTPMALMLLPYWTDGCVGSMEGLYFESSATTPYHFLVQSELSAAPSRAQRDLPYGPLDVATGVEHLKRLGVRYYMAISPEAQAQARGVPDLRLVATSGPWSVRYKEELEERTWEIYEVSGSELVSPLENEPVVLGGVDHGRAWLDAAAKWHQDPSLASVVLAADGPDDWRRIQAPEVRGPRFPIRPATVSDIRVEDDRISFDVDRPGSPVLVKASYFPNWQATGADGPWRATPNLMVVVPTERHVELHYGTTAVDRMGWALTLAGLAGTVVVARRRRPMDEDRTGAEEPAAAEEDVDRELSEVLAVPAVVTGTDEPG